MVDLTAVLAEWPYDPGRTLRMIFADDGRSVLQVRLPLGIEQYELEGRPDGVCPFDTGTVLEEFENRLSTYVEQHGGESGFEISHDDFRLLQNEGILFYCRYLLLFQMNDHGRVMRDTDHNLRICGLVERFVRSDEDRVSLLQYRPYIMRVNATSRALHLVQHGRKQEAESTIRNAIDVIQALPEIESPTFQFERIRSVNYLKSALRQVNDKDVELADALKGELRRAVEEENYERAAELRDRIRDLD